MYYEQGNPSACTAPDVMVTKGVLGKQPRRSFRLWEEGVAPTVIFEVTSDKSCYEDAEAKPRVYAALGVSEYFVFDPDGDDDNPVLQTYSEQADAAAEMEAELARLRRAQDHPRPPN